MLLFFEDYTHFKMGLRIVLVSALVACTAGQLDTTTKAPQHDCTQYEKALGCNGAKEAGERACAWNSVSGIKR